MKTFKTIIEQNIKYSTDNNTLYIDQVIKEAYYNQVNSDLEDAYCKLLDALVEYSNLLNKLNNQRQRIIDINNQFREFDSKHHQNVLLKDKINKLNTEISNLSNEDNLTKDAILKIQSLRKERNTLENTMYQNLAYMDECATVPVLEKAKKEEQVTVKKINELLRFISTIINNYLSQNKKPLISGYSGIIRTDITNNLPKESFSKRVQLSNLVVAYADLMESLCPKLINIGNGIINHQNRVYNEIPYEEVKMLNIINTLSYEYLSYLQRVILTFKTDNFSIDGELENKIMLLEIAKEYMKNGHFDEEKINITSEYYNKRFGITPQVAYDFYTLSRAKKGN